MKILVDPHRVGDPLGRRVAQLRPTPRERRQDGLVQPALAHPLDDIRLEDEPDFVELVDLDKIELPYDIAAFRPPLDQAAVGQHLERLAHGAAADLELGAQDFFGEDALPADSANEGCACSSA